MENIIIQKDIINRFLDFVIDRGFKPGNSVCFIGNYTGLTSWGHVPEVIDEHIVEARRVFDRIISDRIDFLGIASESCGGDYLERYRQLFIAFRKELHDIYHDKNFSSDEAIENMRPIELNRCSNKLIDIITIRVWSAYRRRRS